MEAIINSGSLHAPPMPTGHTSLGSILLPPPPGMDAHGFRTKTSDRGIRNKPGVHEPLSVGGGVGIIGESMVITSLCTNRYTCNS